MLGQWRVVLKQAEESARAGRFDEALTLVNRPDVADHRVAVRLRHRLALDLVARASRRAEADDLAGAVADLNLAEGCGAPPDALAAARLALAERVAPEVRADLDAGMPARVVERVERLARDKVSGPALRRTREAAEAWRDALDEARRGEFGRALEQLDRAERLAGESARGAVAASRRDIEGRQKAAHPKVEKLYAALAEGRWPETLAAAEDLLETVPEHPAARQARSRAWQQIGAISPAGAAPLPSPNIKRAVALGFGNVKAGSPEGDPAIRFLDDEPTRPALRHGRPDERCPFCGGAMLIRESNRGAFLSCVAYPKCRGTRPLAAASRRPAPTLAIPAPTVDLPRPDRDEPGARFLLWADAIGGYLVCLGDRVVIGRAGAEGRRPPEIALLGDLAREHASIVRDGDCYVLRASAPTFVNGRAIEAAPLRDGDVIRLGPTVELEFRQPSPVSSTARLAILSRHRLPVAVDGVILMGETCIIGPAPQAHVPAPRLRESVVLYRQGQSLWCRAPGAFEVDGKPAVGRAALTHKSNVLGEGFSFSLEPLGPRPGPIG
ncbi:MAG TPA: topoisomerase DNA-binding C4 zinc finger domain-containing protein [Isosphaeraceae bacterium]|jgi:tetratricopeptide (TPR) repeat protein|nr:topoisomerase DNA-binding C4 zinc finger domain-containing protein [Isosphaeraceae bacterium]